MTKAANITDEAEAAESTVTLYSLYLQGIPESRQGLYFDRFYDRRGIRIPCIPDAPQQFDLTEADVRYFYGLKHILIGSTPEECRAKTPGFINDFVAKLTPRQKQELIKPVQPLAPKTDPKDEVPAILASAQTTQVPASTVPAPPSQTPPLAAGLPGGSPPAGDAAAGPPK